MTLVLRARSGLGLPVRIHAAIAGTMVVAFAVTLCLWALDARTLTGASVWAKPLKFELALALHAGTLALVVARMGPTHRTGAFMKAVAWVFLAACVIEMGWIIGQAAQGQQSHFNDSTGLHRAMFSVMAVCAVIITGAAGAIACAVWWDAGFRAPKAVKFGVVLGLMGGTMLTLYTAFAIGANGSPYVGHLPDPAARMALTGWSMAGGDLRVAHFLATHMMQVIPATALICAGVFPPRAGLRVVAAIAVLWAGWTVAEHLRALDGVASPLELWAG